MKKENSLSSLRQHSVSLNALVSALVLGIKFIKYFTVLTIESEEGLVLVEKILYRRT